MSSNAKDVEAFSMEWPSEEDNAFFAKFAKIEGAREMIRTTPVTLKLPPCKIVFQNLDQLPSDRPLHHHIGRIFDIFIKNNIKKVNGSLKLTKFWLNLQHPAYNEKDGFWIMHKTYEMANGHTLMNIISKHSQSKRELALDEDMVLSMRIFKEGGLVGRGSRLPDVILKKFGMKRPHVLGDTHCLLKAIAIGRTWSDMNSLENDAQVREDAKNKYRCLTRGDNTVASRSRLQMDEAVKLLNETEMDPNVIEHNLEDLSTIARHLPNYIFRVWSVQPGLAVPTVTFEANINAGGLIPLFYHDGHYEFFNPTCANVNVHVDEWIVNRQTT
ncbi:hypothetical protein CAEBREN_17667 [Caenorhabditis brenneri]|uniref:OTU domain-containing protein n=1 Tax=Caenorhabditis brenneri TaxID=135651 RepID=G0ME74_CAEBE|nr:hypothetical protein CAEBREN_17667 [Caenorhabditis brenneri]